MLRVSLADQIINRSLGLGIVRSKYSGFKRMIVTHIPTSVCAKQGSGDQWKLGHDVIRRVIYDTSSVRFT